MRAGRELAPGVLSDAQEKQFVHGGFVKLENAFPKEIAAEAREILWREAGCDPEDRRAWTRPVVRIGDCAPGKICSHPTETPIVATAYPAFLEGSGESRLRNPLR